MSKNKPFKKLIWAYDPLEGLDETQAHVAKTVSFFAQKTKASVQPVYVLSPADLTLPFELSAPHVSRLVPIAKKTVRNSLKSVHLKGLTRGKVIVQRTLSLGPAVHALLKYAKSEHADLIVVGTHARKGLSRLLLGSFAETLVLHSKIPLLMINPHATPRPIENILYPTDLGSSSAKIFKEVCLLARDLGAKVTLLHVTQRPIEPIFQTGVYLIGGGWITAPDFMRASEQRLRQVAEKWKQQAALSGVTVSIEFESGTSGTRQAILNRALKSGAGLIAMAAQSGAGSAALMGSLARQVIREAPCPVWVLRRS